jgi:AcrR family transcriptional regulator
MSEGLRAKKRELLRSAIEKAAVELVLEHGYDNVTVDMICEASLASQRTFFNYFGSKEAVILGPPPGPPSPEMVEEFVGARGDVLSDLTRMMTRVLIEHGEVDLELWRRRRDAIRNTPELLRSMADRIAAAEAELVGVVARRLRASHARTAGDAGDGARAEAELIVHMWWGVARYAMHMWAEQPGMSSQQITDDLLTLLARIKES